MNEDQQSRLDRFTTTEESEPLVLVEQWRVPSSGDLEISLPDLASNLPADSAKISPARI